MALTINQLIALGQVRARTQGDVAVTTTGGRLLPFNPMRTKLLVINSEVNPGFVTRSPPPALNTGRRLDASGGGFSDRFEISGYKLGSEYWAILQTANGVLYVEEEEAYLTPGQELAV